MSRLTGNKILFWGLVLLVAYWGTGWMFPGKFVSQTSALFALFAGLATLLRYAGTAWAIVFYKLRNEGADDGSHLAVLGTVAIALGVVYAGIYVLLWNFVGAPVSWSNTVVSSFPRALWGLGFILLLVSPDVTRAGLKMPHGIWPLLFAAMAAAMIFLLGVRVGAYQAEYSDRSGGLFAPRIVQQK